ncbi:hypothetical protein JCM6882_008344 [Rhodosporidiobolus microsporus]
MMIGAAKAAYNLYQGGGLNEKPRSSVSALIDILCLPRYEEEDLDGVPELVESVNLQPQTGPTEASRAIRKKLKYSDTHGQLRALTLLNALVENSGSRFQTTFANERLVDRIKLMAGDPHTEEKVKRKLMRVLKNWHLQFKDDPRMQFVAGLYKSCGGGQASRSAATDAYEAQQARYERESAARAERKESERRAREAEKERVAKEKADKARRKEQERGGRSKRPPFNFNQEKPKIMASVGQGTQSAQALIMALQRVNREKESVTTNARVQECLEKAKQDRKALIRYIQLITHSEKDMEGDYIGTLLATNEQIINAVHLYDRMCKPADLDSDDADSDAEAIELAKQMALEQGLQVPPSATPGDNSRTADDTQSIRSRLSAFDMQDREVDKMQRTQRRRLERHLSSRGQVGAGGVHPDLQDLAFGSTASGSSSLPPPIQPHSAEDVYTHGSLSDYSDYSSDEDYSSDASVRAGPSASTSTSTSAAAPAAGATPARSYAQYVREEDERTGKGKGLLEEPEEDDPFADPFGDSAEAGDAASAYEVLTPGISDKRQEWREV